MKLYRTDHAMIGCRHLRTAITAIMQGIVTPGGKLSDGSFGKIVIYREFPIL